MTSTTYTHIHTHTHTHIYTYSGAEDHVTCITIIDTIIQTNYTNDAYYYDTSVELKTTYGYELTLFAVAAEARGGAFAQIDTKVGVRNNHNN
jgi:hypothetical protein